MIKIINGDILDANEDIICQQVNCQGVMGSGLAKQIRDKYTEVYVAYKQLCSMYKPNEILGFAQIVECNDGKLVCNIAGQLNYGKEKQHTDYEALHNGLDSLFNSVINIKKYKGKSIAIPYKIGCGLGGGDWDVVYKIIENLVNYYNCDITIYKKEN